MSYFQKMANQFLNLISTTDIDDDAEILPLKGVNFEKYFDFPE